MRGKIQHKSVMPNIAGIIYPTAFQMTERIRSMSSVLQDSNSLSHPSPEYLIHKNIELGAWNTSIFSNEKKSLHAMIDGKIHNYNELRLELKALGFYFTTNEDPELIVYAYEAWKEDFVNRIDGAFAIAIFDEENDDLFLFRDRIGQKRIYWTSVGNFWLFSTQIKGLLATELVLQNPSINGMAAYLYFGFIPQDLSLIEGVNKILPGHYLKVNLNRQLKIGQYWSFSKALENKLTISNERASEKFGALLEKAVRGPLPPDGKIAAYLNAELGSSSLVWYLSHLVTRDRLMTFSALFDEPQPLEHNRSSDIAEKLSIFHQEKIITPEEVLQEIVEIVWQLDEPVADPFLSQTWQYGKMAGNECSAAFVDLGWIEMLAGNSLYSHSLKKEKHSIAYFLGNLPKSFRNRVLFPILKWIGSDYLYQILRNIEINFEQITYLKKTSLFNEKERKKAFPFLAQNFNPEVFTQRFHRLEKKSDSIDSFLYYDVKTKLPDQLLFQYERLLSAHALETVAPFLDWHLVEFLASMPEKIKFEENGPAVMLRRLMKRLCNECPSYKERSDTFVNIWCTNKKFKNIFSQLQYGKLVENELISGKWIEKQLKKRALSPRVFRQLWSMLILEIWYQLFIGKTISKDSKKTFLEDFL